MCQFDHQLTLKELLDYCSDPGNKCWECAWREFVNRYKKYIYDVLRYKSYGYMLPRLKKEFSEVINDLFDEVVILLCNHGCKALRDFRERENEIKFRAWLRVVCNRKADAYIRKNYVPMLIESEAGEVQNFLMGFEIDDRWQLYEEHVAVLRTNKKNKKQNIERDINIFKLYVWAGFTDSMIKSTPCLKEIGPRVVDLVVNRTRQFFRESAKKNNNKRESY